LFSFSIKSQMIRLENECIIYLNPSQNPILLTDCLQVKKNFAFILRLSFLHIHLNAVFNVCIFFETARALTQQKKRQEERKKKKDMNDKHQKNIQWNRTYLEKGA
jgi:hypothetical protein